ncbi:MAG: hypothetical protein IJH34_11400 [Romboutsia sp.]|nr:hypothetical protein [Romboutsia sp.]
MGLSSNKTMELSSGDIKGLFKKKKCKKCGCKLEKIYEVQDAGEQKLYVGKYVFKGDTKEYKLKYKCNQCDSIYELSEL